MAGGKIFRARPKPKGKELATVKQVKRLIVSNLDRLDLYRNMPSTACAIAGNIYQVSTNSMDNAKFNNLSFGLRFQLPTGSPDEVVRFILFQWKEPSLPVVGDIIGVVSTIPTSMYEPRMCGGRLHVLHDSLFSMVNTSTNLRTVKKDIYQKKMVACHRDTTTIYSKGAIYALFLSTGANTTAQGQFHLTYYNT